GEPETSGARWSVDAVNQGIDTNGASNEVMTVAIAIRAMAIINADCLERSAVSGRSTAGEMQIAITASSRNNATNVRTVRRHDISYDDVITNGSRGTATRTGLAPHRNCTTRKAPELSAQGLSPVY